MRLLKETDIVALLNPLDAVAASRKAFLSIERETSLIPKRIIVPVETNKITHGDSLFKPGLCAEGNKGNPSVACLGLKVVHVRKSNAKLTPPMTTVPATMTLYDVATGELTAVLSATYLTAMRTAAGSAVATGLCASTKKRQQLVVFGAGLQAFCHVLTLCSVRDISEVVVVNRSEHRAEELIDKVNRELGIVLQEAAKSHSNEAKLATQTVPRLRAISGISYCSSMLDYVSMGKETSTEEQKEALKASAEDLKNVLRAADIICTTTGSDSPLFNGEVSFPVMF